MSLRNAVHLCRVLFLGVCLHASAPDPALAAEARPEGDRCDYGITLAMTGNLARAESVFVSLLAPGRGDARAFNNLGNLELLRGEVEVSLAFYDRALHSDSSDAGISLNRAVALMLLGREDESREQAESSIRRAGGIKAAAELLGLHLADSTDSAAKAAQRSFVSREEVQALLLSAARGVPRDSTARAGAPASGGRPARRPAPAWRSGGPRAAQESDAHAILYWKR